MNMSVSESQTNTIDTRGPVRPTVPSPEINSPTSGESTDNALVKPVDKNEEGDGPKLSREETEELVETLEDLAETIQTKLNFSIHETTNDYVVKIMDKETDTVIKQFPSEELLELQEKMIDLTGFLFDADV
ncbi:MAG TPA: flagellar biosynthesis protein FlaG [Desulfobacteraceae bacterium]|nr:flagellar biosynthesis protein FlaG [Desulfobacteraceae bacterium]